MLNDNEMFEEAEVITDYLEYDSGWVKYSTEIEIDKIKYSLYEKSFVEVCEEMVTYLLNEWLKHHKSYKYSDKESIDNLTWIIKGMYGDYSKKVLAFKVIGEPYHIYTIDVTNLKNILLKKINVHNYNKYYGDGLEEPEIIIL